MPYFTRVSCAAMIGFTSCGGTWVQIPPAIDLTRHEIIGVVDFATETEGDLSAYTTSAFIENMRVDQGLIRIVELGPQPALLASLNLRQMDRAAFQTIGEAHQLTSIVTGQLDISNVRPAVRITPDLADLSAAADVDATLRVRMVETSSGASIWNRTAEATRRVGNVSLRGSRIVFDAEDPERSYGELVQALVELTTQDFRVTWEKR